MIKKIPKMVAVFPIILGIVSSVCFFIQGGFGRGDGPLDHILFLLGLPAILYFFIPTPEVFDHLYLYHGNQRVNDFIFIIWIPSLLNSLLFFLIATLVSKVITHCEEKKNKSQPVH